MNDLDKIRKITMGLKREYNAVVVLCAKKENDKIIINCSTDSDVDGDIDKLLLHAIRRKR